MPRGKPKDRRMAPGDAGRLIAESWLRAERHSGDITIRSSLEENPEAWSAGSGKHFLYRRTISLDNSIRFYIDPDPQSLYEMVNAILAEVERLHQKEVERKRAEIEEQTAGLQDLVRKLRDDEGEAAPAVGMEALSKDGE